MCSHDELNDALPEFMADAGLEPITSRELAERLNAPDAPAPLPMNVEPCRKCRGRGRFISYAGRDCGPCHTCKGKGTQAFKADAATRAAARQSVAARKERKADGWKAEHVAEAAWIESRAGRFRFAADMLATVDRYGYLTERQLEAVRRIMAQDAERDAARAAEAVARVAAAPAVNVAALEEAFQRAQEAGAKSPRIRLAEFKFAPAKAGSANAGALYVRTEAGDYLGKIVAGKFQRARECSADQEARIVEVAADPKSAAIAYGRKFGVCCICARDLSNAESVELGIGPICAAKWGW